MARRTQKSDPIVIPEASPEQPPVTYLTNPISVSTATPKTRDDIALRDAVRARLNAIESAIGEFVAEKQSEGFSLAEINELYALELPMLLGYRADGGRIRAEYDAQIVEKGA